VLCPAPIAYAATTSEGATRTIPDVWTNYSVSRIPLPSSFGPVSYGVPALIMLLAALGRLFGAAFALPWSDMSIPSSASLAYQGGAGCFC
jgi:hypothetical protein